MYKPAQENGFSDLSAAAFDPVSEPSFPKSLYLMHPLFTSYELNPVASIAQASVPVPDGLDLDAWIVPSMQERVVDEHDDGDVNERKTKRSKKGKERESTSKTKVKGGKKKQRVDGQLEELAPQEEETAEEKAERERVGIFLYKLCIIFISDERYAAQGRAPGTNAGRPILHYGRSISKASRRGYRFNTRRPTRRSPTTTKRYTFISAHMSEN